jgi:shikimate kinase
MASGKSFLGRSVARVLNMEFCDLDDYIESQAQKKVEEIFSADGEEAFRKIESACLDNTFEWSDTIVATGGGTPCFGNNMEAMNKHGITIFLDCPAKIIADRLTHSKRIRPLIENVPTEHLAAFIASHLEKRMPFYAQAQYAVRITEWKEENINNLIDLIRNL